MSLTVNFGIGSAFSKDSGSAFFEGPVPDPVRFTKYTVRIIVPWLYQQNKSSAFKVKFKLVSNHCKKVLEA